MVIDWAAQQAASDAARAQAAAVDEQARAHSARARALMEHPQMAQMELLSEIGRRVERIEARLGITEDEHVVA
jgi:hypothetical protein